MKQTSIDAYHSIKDDLGNIHKDIIKGLKKINKGTARQIARASYLRSEQVFKRLSELRKQDLIVEDGTTICTTSKRRVTIWKLNQ
jgi:predicted transcriptional regulator